MVMLARLVAAVLVLAQAIPPLAVCPAPHQELVKAATVCECCDCGGSCPDMPAQPAPTPRGCCLVGPCGSAAVVPIAPRIEPVKSATVAPVVFTAAPTPLSRLHPRADFESHTLVRGRLRPTLCIWVI
jgi:hypothetical protein